MQVQALIPLPHWQECGNAPDQDEDNVDADFSDWKIDLKFHSKETGDATATYAVHKYVIGGRSEYFKCLVSDGKFLESAKNRSTIELPKCGTVTKNDFETLLDYFYTGRVILKPKNAVPLAYLSDYLAVDELYNSINEYISTEVPSVCATLYDKAFILGLDNLTSSVAKSCSRDVRSMSMIGEASKEAEIQRRISFWGTVLEQRMQSSSTETESETLKWSTELARFLNHYSGHIDKDTFLSFTTLQKLPVVSSEAAFLLLEQEHELKLDSNDGITDLQRRCMEPIRDRAHYYLHSSAYRVMLRGKLQKLSPAVLEKIISYLIDAAQMQLPPKSIEVIGSDEPCVNGIYTLSRINWRYRDSRDYKSACGKFLMHKFDDIDFQISEAEGSNKQLYRTEKSIFSSASQGDKDSPPVIGWVDANGERTALEVVYRWNK